MKTTRIHLVIAALATLATNAAEPKPPVDRRPPPPQPLQKVLDQDRDGKLSPTEISQASIALIALDKDGDGALSRKEILPKPPKIKAVDVLQNGLPPKPKGPPPILKALDLDKDGSLSADEIEDAPVSLLTLDKNEDGTISRKELNPGKPPAKI
jgi:hypothetical protein